MDFSQLPPCQVHVNDLYVFSLGGSIPMPQSHNLNRSKIFLEKIFPTWGIPTDLHSDRGTHFTGHITQSVRPGGFCHHSQSSSLVECTNKVFKTQLAKLMESFHLPWPETLPLILLNRRSTPLGKSRLSPFEIITGRPMRLGMNLNC